MQSSRRFQGQPITRTHLMIAVVWLSFWGGYRFANMQPMRDARAVQAERDDLAVMFEQNNELAKVCGALPSGDAQTGCNAEAAQTGEMLAGLQKHIEGDE